VTSRLHAQVDGPPDAPVLVLGSSLGTTGAMGHPQLAVLAERCRVIRYDHLGHGKVS
jgi:3-oxoadipate enol-lactonase